MPKGGCGTSIAVVIRAARDFLCRTGQGLLAVRWVKAKLFYFNIFQNEKKCYKCRLELSNVLIWANIWNF